MKQIVFPLKPPMQGPAVDDLQEALTLFGLTIAGAEKTAQRYGASIRQAVSKFQAEHQLPTSGGVDQATAEAINRRLAKRDIRVARHQEELAGERLALFVETVN